MAYKIEELQLQNFGMVGDFHCDKFSNINLIIGENGTGKTFLLKALYCSIRCAISSCSLLASLESNTSTLSPPTAASCSSMDSSPSSSGKSIFPPLTMSEIGAGTNPVCWMFSIIFSIAFGVPSNLLRTI